MPFSLSSLFTMNLIEITIYSLIAILTLLGVIKCIYPLFRNAHTLQRAVFKLEKNSSKGSGNIWNDPQFMGRSLRFEWGNFLINAGQLNKRGVSCDITDYFNEETVIDKPGNAQFADLLPTLLTSLGILGTFVGLMQGLSSVDFSNAEGTIQTIPHLLSGMRFAFATSVAGIASSLLFNMLQRMAAGRAYNALITFEDVLYDLAMPRPLTHDVQLFCQQQDEEKRIAQLIELMGHRISTSLETAISRAMIPLNQSLETFMHGVTREQTEGVSRITNQFIQQMNLSLQGELTALSESMKAVTMGQAETKQNLYTSLSLSTSFVESAQKIEQATSEIASKILLLSDRMQVQGEESIHILKQNYATAQFFMEQMNSLNQALTQWNEIVTKENETRQTESEA